jgi:hypothetical protein
MLRSHVGPRCRVSPPCGRSWRATVSSLSLSLSRGQRESPDGQQERESSDSTMGERNSNRNSNSNGAQQAAGGEQHHHHHQRQEEAPHAPSPPLPPQPRGPSPPQQRGAAGRGRRRTAAATATRRSPSPCAPNPSSVSTVYTHPLSPRMITFNSTFLRPDIALPARPPQQRTHEHENGASLHSLRCTVFFSKTFLLRIERFLTLLLRKYTHFNAITRWDYNIPLYTAL